MSEYEDIAIRINEDTHEQMQGLLMSYLVDLGLGPESLSLIQHMRHKNDYSTFFDSVGQSLMNHIIVQGATKYAKEILGSTVREEALGKHAEVWIHTRRKPSNIKLYK